MRLVFVDRSVLDEATSQLTLSEAVRHGQREYAENLHSGNVQENS